MRHFRDQFLHHHIQHGSGSKAEQIGQSRHHDACRQNCQHRPDGLFTVVINESNRELQWQGASYSGAHPVFVAIFTIT